MPGRTLSTEDYRFGFNDKENLNDVKGVGKLQDYGERIYDSRLGKWLSVDPVTAKFPNEGPYNFSGNDPLFYIDKFGEVKVTYLTIIENGKTQTFKKVDQNFVRSVVDDHAYVGHYDGKLHDVSHDHDVLENIVLNLDDPSKSNITETDLGRTRSTAGEVGHTIAGVFKDIAKWKGGSGGIEFYSINGQGQEERMGTGNIESENIDELLSVIDAAKGAAEVEGGLFELPKLLGNWAENGTEVFTKIAGITEAVSNSHEVGEVARELINSSRPENKASQGNSQGKSKPERFTCSVCPNDTFDSKDKKLHKGIISTVPNK